MISKTYIGAGALDAAQIEKCNDFFLMTHGLVEEATDTIEKRCKTK